MQKVHMKKNEGEKFSVRRLELLAKGTYEEKGRGEVLSQTARIIWKNTYEEKEGRDKNSLIFNGIYEVNIDTFLKKIIYYLS
jgi:hypothetical protein